MWEWATECGSSLDWWESELANIVWFIETENAFNLVEINVFLNFDYIRVQMLDVFDVGKDECFFWVKAESNNVFYFKLLSKSESPSTIWS